MFLGIDIGTSSSKGVLVAPDGAVVATAVHEHRTATPRPGWFEHDADEIWWADFLAITRELARPGVAAVGISGIGPCVLPCDAGGTPLRPAILYGVDTRATAEIAAQTERYGKAAIMERCGSPLTSQAAGPKLEWLRAHEPGVWERTRRMFMAHSWLAYRLTGAYVLDHHAASQCTPLYDTRAHTWITEWADDIAPGLELPELAWSGEVAGTVTAAAAADTGLPAGIPVVAGTIDAWAEACSAGVTAPGDVMLMYGTTMFIVEVLAARAASPQLWGTVGIAPGTYNLAAGMATSGAITGWLRDLTGASFEDLTAEAAAIGRGAEGLLMLPYFAGERTPVFDPDARGTLIGMTLRHGRGHLYRAALEATAFGVRHNLETMRAAGGTGRRLVAVGGGTQGGLWTQIVSDVLQQPQVLPAHTVGATYGDAMLAARACGVASEGWNPAVATVEPDPGAAGDYDRLYHLYRDLYRSTRHIAHALA
ncbi:sugar kinase [Nonomuraea sp. KC401]|uniref:FGGY-family carbohydrate kinase n=1 Tax=unclassified Nonomuraea TaxID=2593643 RepID=UPI0010FEF47B|nr:MULTISPECIES: FGGY-family carbohydrate kinase [unclassified Nonomuraea]NBE92178.1 sugar kinase [Nonomuraea sp. K271]TLF85670.1 sugar kinase [Nonomuraea sp. KC401]